MLLFFSFFLGNYACEPSLWWSSSQEKLQSRVSPQWWRQDGRGKFCMQTFSFGGSCCSRHTRVVVVLAQGKLPFVSDRRCGASTSTSTIHPHNNLNPCFPCHSLSVTSCSFLTPLYALLFIVMFFSVLLLQFCFGVFFRKKKKNASRHFLFFFSCFAMSPPFPCTYAHIFAGFSRFSRSDILFAKTCFFFVFFLIAKNSSKLHHEKQMQPNLHIRLITPIIAIFLFKKKQNKKKTKKPHTIA